MTSYNLIKERLMKAQDERPKRRDIVQNNGEFVLEWVLFERQEMIKVVNEIRQQKGFEAIDEEKVLKCETLAGGHIDYTHQFALYCAFLADNNEGSIRAF